MHNSTIITINRDGIILSVDKNCCKLFGYDFEELAGRKVNVLIPAPYKEQHDSYLQNYQRTQIPRIIGKSRVVEGQHKDGSIFPIRLSVSKIGDGDDVVFVGMIDKLEDKTGAITIDAKGTIVSCNQNVEELFGYKSDELIGNNVKKIMASPHREKHDQYLKNYAEGGKPKVIGRVRNVFAQHKNGTVFPISLQVEHIKMGSIELFRGKIEKVDSMEAVFTIDANGTIISCNQNFVTPLFGYTNSELIGSNISSLIPKIYRSSGEVAHTSTGEPVAKKPRRVNFDPQAKLNMHWKEPGCHLEELRHKDGSLFLVNLEVHPFKSADGSRMFSGKIKRASEPKIEDSGSGKSIGNYWVTKTLGQGTYGKVKLGVHKTEKKEVAIKILQKSEMKAIELERARREIEILSKLDHKNIAKLYEFQETEDQMYLIMEYGGRTLLSYVMDHGGLAESEAREFFLQMLSAVHYCHKANIIHRDIKHQNILLDENNTVKIIDFGLSNFMQEGKLRSTFCGTPAYAAPEMILGKKYVGPEVDVWSLGIVLYSMITGAFPFENVCDILNGTYEDPKSVSRACCDILRRMLTVDTSKRVNVFQLLEHEWIKNSIENSDSKTDVVEIECEVLETTQTENFSSSEESNQKS